MKFTKLIILFLIINFGSLVFGSLLMNNGPMTEWYINLNKAPWTPPSWVFGFAWTTIMLCFSIYLAYLFNKADSHKARIAFIIQVVLNVSWNYVFFNQHLTQLGLIILLFLIVTLCYFFFSLKEKLEKIRYLLLPYLIWLCIATSLNLYVIIHN